jgi:hypothetical protein
MNKSTHSNPQLFISINIKCAIAKANAILLKFLLFSLVVTEIAVVVSVCNDVLSRKLLISF